MLHAAGGGKVFSEWSRCPALGDRASLLFGTSADVLDLSAAVGDDPPEAAEAVRALDDLRDGHGNRIPRPPYTGRLLCGVGVRLFLG